MFNLLDKIQALKDRFLKGRAEPSNITVIDSWMERAKQLFILKSLKDHDGIKYVLEIFETEVNRINDQLIKADSKTLPDGQRDRLMDRRDLAQKYLNLFNPIDSELQALEEKVDSEL